MSAGSQFCRLFLSAFVVVALLGAAAAATGPGAEPSLQVPEDDLPFALVNGHRIDFSANGAMVISREGTMLCDVCLMYTNPDWSEWGTQRRRSASTDSWERDPDNPMVLVHHGTLYRHDGAPRFKFVQRTTVGESGLRLRYEVQPLDDLEVGLFGVVVHSPTKATSGARISLWPGFSSVICPAELGSGQLFDGPGRGAFLGPAGRPLLELIMEDGTWWSVLDDRQWDLNTYRLIAADWRSKAALNEKQTGSFEVELRLAPQPHKVAQLAGLSLEADRYGGTVLADGSGPVAELGFTWREDARKWLRHRGLPQAAEPAAQGSADYEAAGSAWIAGATVSFKVATRPETGGSASISEELDIPPDSAPTEPVSWAAMVPADKLQRPPQVTQGRGTWRVALPLTDGPTLVLESEGEWQVATETERERDYVLVQTEPAAPDENTRAVAVRISTEEGQTP